MQFSLSERKRNPLYSHWRQEGKADHSYTVCARKFSLCLQATSKHPIVLSLKMHNQQKCHLCAYWNHCLPCVVWGLFCLFGEGESDLNISSHMFYMPASKRLYSSHKSVTLNILFSLFGFIPETGYHVAQAWLKRDARMASLASSSASLIP